MGRLHFPTSERVEMLPNIELC